MRVFVEAWYREADDRQRFREVKKLLENFEEEWLSAMEFRDIPKEEFESYRKSKEELEKEFWRLGERIQAPLSEVGVGRANRRFHDLSARFNEVGMEGGDPELESQLWWLAKITNQLPTVSWKVFQRAPRSQLPTVRYRILYRKKAPHPNYPTGVTVEEGVVDESGDLIPVEKGLYTSKIGEREDPADVVLQTLKDYAWVPGELNKKRERTDLTYFDPLTQRERPLQEIEYVFQTFGSHFLYALAQQMRKTLGQQKLPLS